MTPTNPTPQTLHELRERVERMRSERISFGYSIAHDGNTAQSKQFLLGMIQGIDNVLAILDGIEEGNG